MSLGVHGMYTVCIESGAPTGSCVRSAHSFTLARSLVSQGLNFDDPEASSAWALLDYQKETDGQTHSFLEHILLGVEETAKDASALLLFSGGQTRKSAGPRASVHVSRLCKSRCRSTHLVRFALAPGMQGIHGLLADR